MDCKKSEPTQKKSGWVFLSLWAILIVLGIVEKRFFGHPDRMVFYHLPAAVFLIVGGYQLSANFRKRNREAMIRFWEQRQGQSLVSKDG